MVIDIHTHAFPDHLAPRAVAQLQAETEDIQAVLDGTTSDLLRSMDRAGIDASVVASIATRPEQFEPILRWSAAIRSPRLLPFPSVHPDAPRLVAGLTFQREDPGSIATAQAGSDAVSRFGKRRSVEGGELWLCDRGARAPRGFVPP